MGDAIDFKSLRKQATTILEGDFTAVVVKTEHVVNASGKDQIKASFKITAGPYTGRTIPHTFTFSPDSPAALQMFFSQMDAFGMGDAFFSAGPTWGQIANGMLGKQVEISLKGETWNGMTREKVKNVKPSSGGLGAGAGAAGALPVATALPVAKALPTAQPTATPSPVDSEEDPF
jgi:hypothetical protein